MPFNKDLRVGQGHWDMNMSWIYECLNDDYHTHITFLEPEAEYHDMCFEEAIERKVNEWILFKVFDNGDPEKFTMYTTIWDYIHDAVIAYQKENPTHIAIQYTDAYDDCAECKAEVTIIWSDGLCDDCHDKK
jgi:hypothetical protein